MCWYVCIYFNFLFGDKAFMVDDLLLTDTYVLYIIHEVAVKRKQNLVCVNNATNVALVYREYA